MKNILLLFLFLIPVFLFAQYPTGTNKSRLGYQTTGDGLIWRGVAADTAIKPRTTANAYFQLDTVNGILRRYIATRGSWQTVSGGGGGGLTMPLDSLVFTPTTADPDTAELKYNADLETFVFGADGTIIEIGQKSAWYVKNQTGSTITKGTVVRASGTLGSSGRILISPMAIDGTVDSKYLLGITASDIADGADGYVIHFGKLRKFNTSAWSDGAVLYAGTGGTLTATEPNPPNLRLPIAFVVHSHATNGILAIRIQTGNELHELHDVDTTGIDNGGVIVWNAASEKWEASDGAAITTADTTSLLATKYWTNSNFFPILGGTLTGTGGAGFIGFPSQVSAPGTPASGLNVYAQGSSFNWKGTDGYERQFASTLTGGRTYTLPDVSGTFALGTGTTDRSARWSATNTLAAGNFTDNGTKVQALLPFQFQTYTTAGLPTGVTGYHVYNTTTNGPGWYQGSRWAYGLESTFNRGTATRIPFFDANGQIIDNAAATINLTGVLGRMEVRGSIDQKTLVVRRTNSAQTTNVFEVASESGGTITGINSLGYIDAIDLRLRNNGRTAFRGVTNFSTFADNVASTFFQVSNSSDGNRLLFTSENGNPLARLAFLSTGAYIYDGTFATSPAPTSLFAVINTTPSRQPMTIKLASPQNVDAFRITSSADVKLFHVESDGKVAIKNSTTAARDLDVNGEVRIRDLTTDTPTKIVGADADGDLADITWLNPASNSLGIGITPTQELDVNGDLRVRDSTRLTTTPAHSAITGLLTRDANGWVGAASLAGGLSYSGGVLTGANIYTSDGTISGLRTVSLGSNGDYFKIDGTSNSKYATISLNSSNSNLYAENEIVSLGYTPAAGYSLNSRKTYDNYAGTALEVNDDFNHSNVFGSTKYSQFLRNMTYNSFSSTNAQTIGEISRIDSTGSSSARYVTARFMRSQSGTSSPRRHWTGLANGGVTNLGTGQRFISYTPNWTVQTQFHNTNTYFDWIRVKDLDAADTTSGNAIEFYNGDYTWKNGRPGTGSNVHVWDNGTPSFKEIKRDTTIFVTADTDYDFSAAVTTAQIASRYNRIIIHMTLTSGVGADKTTTLHAPDANLMQCEILIRGTDNTGSYDNEINFGTNNAISSDGTNASGYTLAQGQGLHVRVVYNGSAYKYIYY